MQRDRRSRFVICVKNRGFAASLKLRKVYRALPDADAKQRRLLRVVDESGEDYLFPCSCFVSIYLPDSVARAVMVAS